MSYSRDEAGYTLRNRLLDELRGLPCFAASYTCFYDMEEKENSLVSAGYLVKFPGQRKNRMLLKNFVYKLLPEMHKALKLTSV